MLLFARFGDDDDDEESILSLCQWPSAHAIK